MSVEGIVSVSEDGDKFLLPRQHRKGVTGGDHMVASMSRFIPMMAQSHLPLLKAFNKDGPLGRIK